MKHRVLSCGMKSPRDCFNCQRADCVCNDSSTAEEGKWMRGTRHKPDRREAPKRVTISVEYDTTRREVKSNFHLANYEKLLF